MIQSNKLPLCEILESTLIADAFEEDGIDFGIADEDVFTPAITLWAMVSQFLFKGTGRSSKLRLAASCRFGQNGQSCRGSKRRKLLSSQN